MENSILYEAQKKLGSIVGKKIEKVVPTDSMITFVTEDGAKVKITAESLFGSFNIFRYYEINQLEGKTITSIDVKFHGYMFHFNEKDNRPRYSTIWAYGIDKIQEIKFSSTPDEMRVHFISSDDFNNYPVYFLVEGRWCLSKFSQGDVIGGLLNLLEKVDLLNHPTVQEALKKHNRLN